MSSRGKNFTERERCKLMELVQKYKHIIENKCSNAVSTIKKNEAWESITTEFNSTGEVPRTNKQLSTAYLNMKRSTRQNIANENIKKYLEHNQNTSSSAVEESNIHNQAVELKTLIKLLKKDEVSDKKGVMGTGGGVHRPRLNSVGAQMLAIMGDQVKPLSNGCDSASNYFINDNNVTTCVVEHTDIIPSCSQNNNIPSLVLQPLSSPELTVPKTKRSQIISKRKMARKLKPDAKQINISTFKKQYYQKKVECATIEKNNRLLEYKMNVKKNKLLDLEIKLKQYEYDSRKK